MDRIRIQKKNQRERSKNSAASRFYPVHPVHPCLNPTTDHRDSFRIESMPITPDQIRHAAVEASASLNRRNIARADLICQSVLAQDVRPSEILFINAQVAMSIGEYATARERFEQALELDPKNPRIIAAVSNARQRENEARKPAPARHRFHLIKAWGCGFTADLDHTLGHLLLAEMTGRTPVIHWGSNSLFKSDGVANAWPDFFERVSPFTIDQLATTDRTFFPTKWSAGNLLSENLSKMTGPGSRTAGISFLNQSADVTVADFFTGVIELLPWVRPPHPLAVTGPIKPPAIEAAYRYLIDKYIKPRPEILASVNSFAAQHFFGKQTLAVHIRGSDKAGETANLAEGHRKIFELAGAELTANPNLLVFLLTDDAKVRSRFATACGARVIFTDCLRTSTQQGVHYLATHDRRQLGIEVLSDAYLAARCDRLLALGCTNVSNFILHLKPWPAGSAKLLGPVTHYQRNLLLHAQHGKSQAGV